MDSTSRTRARNAAQEQQPLLRWRCWPLVDRARWSWLAPVGVVVVGGIVVYMSGSWLLGPLVAAGLAATLWQCFVPVHYEIAALGLRRSALGRSRLVPWQAVRAYQLRSTGIVLYQRPDPTKVDLLRSIFVPYPADEDELLCAVRENLAHAVELPR